VQNCEAIANAVERGLLREHDTADQLAIHVAVMKRQDAGGKDWSPDDAVQKMQTIADSRIEHCYCLRSSEFDHTQSRCYDVSKHRQGAT
jgi:hypothetical protein